MQETAFYEIAISLIYSGMFVFAAAHQLWRSRLTPARFEKSLNDARSISNVDIVWLDTLTIKDPEVLKMLSSAIELYARSSIF